MVVLSMIQGHRLAGIMTDGLTLVLTVNGRSLTMIKTIIESPFQGNVVENMEYLQECIRHSISLGEAPFASHQMYTSALDDAKPKERTAGIYAGYEWMMEASLVAFYVDKGMSDGMHKALNYAVYLKKPILFRRLLKGE
jgi:hypothetical protein